MPGKGLVVRDGAGGVAAKAKTAAVAMAAGVDARARRGGGVRRLQVSRIFRTRLAAAINL